MYYSILLKVSEGQDITESNETWHRKSMTRKEFESWMVLNPDDGEEINQRKIRAISHKKFPGPFIELYGKKFELPPREE